MATQSESSRREALSTEQIRQILTDQYAIGIFTEAVQVTEKLSSNVTYKVITTRQGVEKVYILRAYNPDSMLRQIRFEHALLVELQRRQFTLVPQVIAAKQGETYLQIRNAQSGQTHYIAVFSFLPGKNRELLSDYVWPAEELASAATVLAHFHQALVGWAGGDCHPPVITQIPEMMANVYQSMQAIQANGASSPFEQCLLEHSNYFKQLFEKFAVRSVEKQLDMLPATTIHGDYQAFNLLFQDGKVSGVLDFEYARRDLRAFELVYTLSLFCAPCSVARSGKIELETVKIFLEHYQQAWRPNAELGPLQKQELACFPEIWMAHTLREVSWITYDYFVNRTDPTLYLIYLPHLVQVMQWMENHWEAAATTLFTELAPATEAGSRT
ncbi:MAG: phosphotransferase [Caldilineaceae bacterium]